MCNNREILFRVPVALLVLVADTMRKVPPIGIGLMIGAIFTLIDAYGNYWRFGSYGLRFGLLRITFIIPVVIANRQFAAREAGNMRSDSWEIKTPNEKLEKRTVASYSPGIDRMSASLQARD